MNSKISALVLASLLCGACITRSLSDAPGDKKVEDSAVSTDGSVSGGDGGDSGGGSNTGNTGNTGNNTTGGTTGGDGGTNTTGPAPECSASKPCTGATLSKCGSGGTCEVCQVSEDCKDVPAKTACVKNMGCFECTQDKNTCTLPKGVCHATTNTCVTCSAANATACTSQGKVCEPNSGTCVDCVSNAQCPTLAAPHCDTTMGTCTTCDADAECAAIDGSKPYCDKTLKQCVACKANADCTSPTASVCNAGVCEGCTGDGSTTCNHIRVRDLKTNAEENAPICLDKECVQCTRTQRGECGASVCNASTHRCEDGVAVGSGQLCGSITPKECVSNDECPTNTTCVQEFLGSQTFTKWYCMPMGGTAACKRPFTTEESRPTRDDAAATICKLRATTCTALSQYSSVPCAKDGDPTTGDNAKCGLAGVDDGYCVNGGASLGFLCTVACSSALAVDCPDVTGPADPTCGGNGLCSF